MESATIKERIEATVPDGEAEVTGDGSHFEAVVVSSAFEGVSKVKRQQMVYKAVNEAITSGELHALTIQAHTPDEWERARKLRVTSG